MSPRILHLAVVASLLAGCQDEVVSEGKSLEMHAALVQKDANALVKDGDPQGAKALADELEARIEDYAETYLVGGMCYVGNRGDVDWLDEGCASTMGLEDAQRQGLDAAQEAFRAVIAIDRSVDPRERQPAWTAPPEMTEETASRLVAAVDGLSETEQWLFQSAFHPGRDLCRLVDRLGNKFDREAALASARNLFARIDPLDAATERVRAVVPLTLGEWSSDAFEVTGQMSRNRGYDDERGADMEGGDVVIEFRKATMCSGGGRQKAPGLAAGDLPGQAVVRVRLRGAAETLGNVVPVGRLTAQHYVERLERAGMQRDRPVAAVLSLKIDGRPSISREKRGLSMVADDTATIDEIAFLPYGAPRENDNRFIGTKKAYIDWGAGPLAVTEP